jgi:iron-sulfur cluster assembly accessory protein
METQTTDTTTTSAPAMSITDIAINKVADLLQQEAEENYFLRVAVQPGGCSGLRYALYFDDRELPDDVQMDYDRGVKVRVDRMSAPYLTGASLDWLEGLEASGFTINNPNATGTCACGDSFH